jgi:hypothetical protein
MDIVENREDGVWGKTIFTNNYAGYEERDTKKDVELVKAMWLLGNIDINDVGIPTGTNCSSIIALDKTSNKIQKNYKKVVRAHISYWSYLCNEMNPLVSILLNIPQMDCMNLKNIHATLLEARVINERLSNSMKTNLPNMDGKIIMDIERNKATGCIEFKNRKVSCVCYLFFTTLYSTALINARLTYFDFEQGYGDFFKSIIEAKAFDPENTDKEVETLHLLGRSLYERGDTSALLTFYRGTGAIIRLSRWRHRSTSISDILYEKLREKYQVCITLTVRERLKIKIQKKAKRPFFTVKRINSIEEEFSIGHFSKKNYKCNHCGIGRNDVVLYECIGCTRAWYCGRRRQKREWSQHRLICGKTDNNWRTEPYFVDSDAYHQWKGCALEMRELNGNMVTLGVDTITDEVFDYFTDRPIRIHKGKERLRWR